jgi:hypothetical protein
MKRTRQKPGARETKQKPVKDVRWDLRFFIRFLRKTGEGSLKAKFDLPEREALQRAVQKLDPCAKSLIGIIEGSGIPEADRWVALHNLWSVLASAYIIGSEGTVGKNTEVYIKALGTAPGRSKAAEKREPQLELMTKLIATAEKACPPGRGHATTVDNDVRVEMKKLGYDVCEETVSRLRRKMPTV